MPEYDNIYDPNDPRSAAFSSEEAEMRYWLKVNDVYLDVKNELGDQYDVTLGVEDQVEKTKQYFDLS